MYIGMLLRKLYADFEELKLFYEDKDWMVDRIEQLQSDLAMLVSLKPYAAINFIRKGIGYDEYIREYAEYRGIRAEDMFDILDELQEDARACETTEAWFDYIKQYGERAGARKQKIRNQRRCGTAIDNAWCQRIGI